MEQPKFTAKERWNHCEIIGRQLDRSKEEIHNFLWTAIRDKGWLEQALEGDGAVLEQIKQLPDWQRMVNQPPPIIVQPKHEPRLHEPKEEPPKTAAERIKLALWFIEKVGGVALAKKAIKAAATALEAADNETDNTPNSD